MSNELIISPQTNELTPLQIAGHVANKHAKTAVFTDYLSRKSANTIRTQGAALALFAQFLAKAGIGGITADCLMNDPDCWRGVTWGIVEAFVKWLLNQGHSIASVNNRLSAVKVYARLAMKAGVISPDDMALIKTVSGYAGKEAKRVNEKRPITRIGEKKAEHVSLTPNQAKQLTDWMVYEGAQGRRDLLLMCLFLEHGLRVGEVARLQVSDFDLKRGELRFYRPKVDKTQTHKLTAKTLQAATAYLKHDALAMGGLLLGSKKGGALTTETMSERAITKRVKYLGETLIGVDGMSAHDCRHYWATDAARNGTDPFRLQEAGGWSSLTMPRRYVEDAKIANQGVRLTAV